LISSDAGLRGGTPRAPVGHEPGLSAVGALLLGTADFPGLQKAQAARIDNGVLRWRFACDADAPEIVVS
jgi:hypothetical protein